MTYIHRDITKICILTVSFRVSECYSVYSNTKIMNNIYPMQDVIWPTNISGIHSPVSVYMMNQITSAQFSYLFPGIVRDCLQKFTDCHFTCKVFDMRWPCQLSVKNSPKILLPLYIWNENACQVIDVELLTFYLLKFIAIVFVQRSLNHRYLPC